MWSIPYCNGCPEPAPRRRRARTRAAAGRPPGALLRRADRPPLAGSSRSTRCLLPPGAFFAAKVAAGQLDRSADRRDRSRLRRARATSRRSSAAASSRCCSPRRTIRSRRTVVAASTRSSARSHGIPRVTDQLAALGLPARQGRLRADAREARGLPPASPPAPTCSAARGWSATTTSRSALILEVHDTAERRIAAAPRSTTRSRRPRPSSAPLAELHRARPALRERLPRRDAALGARVLRALRRLRRRAQRSSLYRSARTLLAFLVTLGVCLALSVGYIGLTGGMFTIVSPMVPMTILVTATATLVYLHSRFVERPPERPVDEHQIFALATSSSPARRRSSPPPSASPRWRSPTSARSARWASGSRSGSPSRGSSSSRCSRRCRRSCARRRSRSGAGREHVVRALRRVAAAASTLSLALAARRAALALSAAGGVALFGLPGRRRADAAADRPGRVHQPRRRRSTRTSSGSEPHDRPACRSRTCGSRAASAASSEPEVLTGLHAFQQALESRSRRRRGRRARPRSCASCAT